MREKETYLGIQGVDLTTAMHLFRPQDTFALADRLNGGKPRDQWTQIEIYPTIGRVLFEPVRNAAKAIGLQLPMTPSVTEKDVRKWQKEYPNTKVARVHLPFSYNLAELWHRPFFGEKGLKDKIYQIAWIMYFGAATNLRGLELAKTLEDQQVGVNAHTNVLEGFAKDGKLNEIKQTIPFVLAENERRYKSPILGDKKAMYDPAVIVDRIVKRYGLNGLVLGVDHGFGQGLDMTDTLVKDSVRKQIRAMHLAKTNPGAQHVIIAIGDKQFEEFLRKAAVTPFTTPVRAALDYGPETMKGKSGEAQLKLVRDTIDWIMATQNKDCNNLLS